MDAFFVVEAIDVTGDGSVEFGVASEAAPVGEFGLRGMEETLSGSHEPSVLWCAIEPIVPVVDEPERCSGQLIG